MESLLTSVANYLACQSWQVSVVFLLVVAACYALRRASAHWRYLLWLIVLAKCLTPAIVSMPLAVLPRPAGMQETSQRPSSPAAMAGRREAHLPAAPAVAESVTATAAASRVVAATEDPPAGRLGRGIAPNRNQGFRTISTPAAQEIAGISSTPVAPAAANASAVRNIDPRVWWSAAWGMGVAIFLGYAFIKAGSTSRKLARTRRAADPRIAAMVAMLAQRLGMKTVPAVYLVEGVAQPFVWGWLRGSVYVPRHFLATGTNQQQEAILAHELAHVARWDAAANLAQIVVQALFFFHPLVWWTNRQVRRERENCCDETVIAGLGADPKLYGQAIVDTLVAEYEASQPAPSLAVTGGLKNVEERIETILSPNRKFFRRPSRAAVITAMLLAACAVPTALVLTVRGQPPTQPKAESAKQAAAPAVKTAAAKHRTPAALKIAVQAADAATGNPLANVPIEVRVFDLKTRKARKTAYKSDAGGNALLAIPQEDLSQISDLRISAHPRTYVPQYYVYLNGEEIPDRISMRFEKGITIGGQVQDPAGQPINGAKVDIQIPAVNNFGMYFRLAMVKSDEQGRWRCDGAPQELSRVMVTAEHSDFMPGRDEATPALKEQKHVIRLERGVIVRGQVLDTKGHPVKGVNVSLGWMWAQSSDPRAKTDAQGQFVLKNCPLGPSAVTVQGAGFAPECRKITVEKENAPLAFSLEPGATLRGRVVDRQGKPLQGVFVAADSWRELRTLEFRTNTNAQGRFVWNNAPRDDVLFALSAEGFMSNRISRLTASTKEHTITLDPELVIRGTVVDDQTGKPIEEFQYCSGFRRDTENQTFFSNRFTAGKNGRFELHMPEEIMPSIYVEVEADGYSPAVSRAFKRTEGEQTFEFKLKKGQGLGGVVLLPDGKPARNATVALASRSSHPYIKNGEMLPNSSGIRAQTDAAGRFNFVPQSESCSFFVLHPRGHAEFSQYDLQKSGSVSLQPWGRLEGVVKIGQQTAKHVGVTLNLDRFNFNREGGWGYETVTDDKGHFAFDRVYPGKGSAARVIALLENEMMQATTGTNPVRVEVLPGKTTQAQIGGKGRVVVGRIDSSGRITNWTDFGQVRSKYDEPGESSNYYSFKVAPDGSFRIDDVAPGRYAIDLRITEPMLHNPPNTGAAFRPGAPIGAVDFDFTVPEIPQGKNDEPLDLGTIRATFRDQRPSAPTDANTNVRQTPSPGLAGLNVHFDPGAGNADKLPFQGVFCEVMWKIPGGGGAMRPIEERKSRTARLDARIMDLKPGDYFVSIRTIPKLDAPNVPRSATRIDPGAYFDRKDVSLKAGQVARVDFPFTPFDPNASRGNRTAVLRIEKPDGTPAAGSKIKVGYFDGHYGALPVFSGAVPASGEIRLDHVTDRKSSLTGWDRGDYSITMEDRLIGFFGFAGHDPVERFVFHLPPKAGDMAPNVELFDVATGKKVRLSDLRGKVVCLEFWASWCGPCQEAMEKLNALAEQKAGDWKDRALIVPVSIDESAEIAKKHAADRGWNRLTHYWAGNEGHAGFESAPMRAFVGSGVPDSILIGPDGRILWRGHPMDDRDGHDLKTRIEAAMKK